MSTIEEAKAAAEELRRIEGEIDRVLESLARNGGSNASLVDPEGFPRSDIDVHATRIDRNELARLRTDRIAAAARAEALLYTVHAEARNLSSSKQASKVVSGSSVVSETAGKTEGKPTQPNKQQPRQKFAIIGDVTIGSPAATAGLMSGDELLLFGSIDATNFDGLASLGTVTRASIGRTIRVMVNRGSSTKLLPLIPQEWGGRGFLGCEVKEM